MTADNANLKDDESMAIQAVDPSWFESPVQRIKHSGGTAPFFMLTLTEAGLAGCNARQKCKRKITDTSYWIGKDLSHAADEKDFYLTLLQIRKKAYTGGITHRDLTEGIGPVEDFMFDYLGVLKTKTDDEGDDGYSYLLVMRNMRNNFNTFRMLDLKIGEKTAQAGWKGKSRLRAMKHHLMDGLSNSSSEGYRLAGFNGCPPVFDSMDPLLDILADESLSAMDTDPEGISAQTKPDNSLHTLWGKVIDESAHAQAKRFMLNSMSGTGIFRYFYDLHMDAAEENYDSDEINTYFPTEVAEIVSHELMTQLMGLSAACHKIKIPQKWIGSSVAVAFDSGFFPKRSSEEGSDTDAEADIRAKVVCKIFDWGRSELLTASEYEKMSKKDKVDHQKYWDLYKDGLNRLSYNATRFYYHQFTKTSMYSDITIHVYDFDSMSTDDFIGKVVIKLPNPSNKGAVEKLSSPDNTTYKLEGRSVAGSTLHCSITWVDFPSHSRMSGTWRVTIEKATDLPPMDIQFNTSDPYCIVYGNKSIPEDGQHFVQKTCVKARNLNPEWNETINVPVCRKSSDAGNYLESALKERGLSSISDMHTLSKHLQWDRSWSFHRANKDDMNWWTKALIAAEDQQ